MAKKKSFTFKKEHKDPDGGLTAKGRADYNRATGSNLKPPAPNPKNKVDAARRKSFCARSAGQADMHDIDCRKTPKKRLCKARRAWAC